MTFRIVALDPSPFAPLFGLTGTALAEHGAVRMTVDEKPGFPCRISLLDAEIGESVLLLNHAHLPVATPYRSAHAIFIREAAVRADPAPGEVPDSIASRLLSVRAFDAAHMMTDADVTPGADLARLLDRLLADPAVAYIHLHYARRGCFAARVERA